jgi:polyhydroxyalkanoate synthesis regulator phasin
VFAGNEEGKRTMTKAEPETFIDHRCQSRCERLEREVESLKRQVNELENKGT